MTPCRFEFGLRLVAGADQDSLATPNFAAEMGEYVDRGMIAPLVVDELTKRYRSDIFRPV
mgnify:CR=1 FL=1